MRASKDRVPSRHLRGWDSRIYFEHKRKLGEGASESASVGLSRLGSWAHVLKSRVTPRGCACGETSAQDQFPFPRSQPGPWLGMWPTMESEVLKVQDAGCVLGRAPSYWIWCDALMRANRKKGGGRAVDRGGPDWSAR